MLIAAFSCGAFSVSTEMFRQSLGDVVSVCALAGAMPAKAAVNITAAVTNPASRIASST
jgi:hypothetical protein